MKKVLKSNYKYLTIVFLLFIFSIMVSNYSFAAVRMPTKTTTFKQHIIDLYGIDEKAEENIFNRNYNSSVLDYKSRLTLYVDANYAIGRSNIKNSYKKLYLYNWN